VASPAESNPRRRALNELAQPYAHGVVVDVGCDHGHVAAALGAIGSERLSNRLPRRGDVQLVVADGIAPFRRVDLAVIAGMGPEKILTILARGPRPSVAVVHSPQHAVSLRVGLAASGWRIDAERLAPENDRYASVMRILPGEETATGHTLRFGPRLLEQGDPHLLNHARQLRGWWGSLADTIPAGVPKRAEADAWVTWLDALLAERSQ